MRSFNKLFLLTSVILVLGGESSSAEHYNYYSLGKYCMPNKKGHSHNQQIKHHKFKSYVLEELSIQVEGNNKVPQKFIDQLESEYLGKEIDTSILKLLIDQIVLFYKHHDYLLPVVKVISNSAKNKSLVLGVSFGSINDVRIEGDHVKDPLMEEYSKKILEQEPSKVSNLNHYLVLMNQISGYTVKYSLNSSSKDKKLVELVLHSSKKKADLQLTFDNFGLKELGRERLGAHIRLYAPFAKDETLSIKAISGKRPFDLSLLKIEFTKPLDYAGTKFNLLAKNAKNYPLALQAPVDYNNYYKKLRASISHPFILQCNKSLEGEVALNYNHSVSSNVTHIISKYHNIVAEFGMNYKRKTINNGKYEFNATYLKGLDGGFKNFDDLEDKTRLDYNVVKAKYQLDQPIIGNLAFHSYVAGQYSNNKLPDMANFSVGGRDIGRAYSPSTLKANSGFGFALEARYLHTVHNPVIDSLQPYIFYDYGYIRNQDPQTKSNQLSSFGGGVRISFEEQVKLEMELASPIKKNLLVVDQEVKASNKFGMFLSKKMDF